MNELIQTHQVEILIMIQFTEEIKLFENRLNICHHKQQQNVINELINFVVNFYIFYLSSNLVLTYYIAILNPSRHNICVHKILNNFNVVKSLHILFSSPFFLCVNSKLIFFFLPHLRQKFCKYNYFICQQNYLLYDICFCFVYTHISYNTHEKQN